ncbi:TonB-dependent receptor domain-containing protein [Sphingomonas koreensis]
MGGIFVYLNDSLRDTVAFSAVAFATLFAPAACAQDATAMPARSQADTESRGKDKSAAEQAGDEIVVTGSRIRRPDLESTVPIASIKSDDIYNQANTNLGEALNNLPQLRSTYAQQNPGLGIGVAGLNLLDLRGLGVNRTLVLVNGRRHVPSDLQNSAASVDINTIPTELVERVDIVTGGNSAVYGSDAIAGVVNFVLRKNFEGLQARGGTSIPQYGAGGSRYLSFVAGKNFAEGRGNITLAGAYSQQDRLFGSQIPWLRRVDGFVGNDTDVGGSDGIPDNVFARDIRSTTIARYGLVPIVETRNGAAPCGTGIMSGGIRPGTNYNCNYIFDSQGNLSPVTGVRRGSGPNGSYLGGNADTGREDRQLSVMPHNQRMSANLLGHYKFSDAADVFIEAKYARVRTIGSNSGPAFDQGFGVTFNDERADFRLDNPFLNAAARTMIVNAILASGSTTGLTGGRALTPADRAAIADGSFRFVNARNLTDLGIRDEDALRETYRVVLGVRGDITPHLNYEVSGSYGRANENIKILGNVNVQRLMLAFDAGISPDGKIKCRSQFDPAARAVIADTNYDGSGVAAGRLAADVAACVPYNAFGGKDNNAARNYIVSNSGSRGHLTQINVTAFVSGDTGGFFRLPGGPVGFVLGGEWRRENAKFEADPDVQAGLTFLNSLQTFDPPALEVKEGFGELNLPILRDVPFFRSLSLSGAARISSYNKAYGSTGTVWAWNFGGEWAPIRDIRFRANYGKAVRAPNYVETSKPFGQDFATFGDPCNANRIGNGHQPNRRTNCEAALGAAINNSAFQNYTNGTYSLEFRNGSNPLLEAETSKSLTVGGVITPRFLPGFDVTIDYFDINVRNVINSAPAQAIVDLCYDEGKFCNLFQRNTLGATGPKGEVPGQILQGSLIQAGLNFASLKRRGIDVQLNYNHSIGTDTSLSARAYYTHQFQNSDYVDPTDPKFETRNLGQLGDPKDELVFNADLTAGKFTFGYGARYIGPMLTTAYANLYPINGQPAQNADIFDITSYPSVLYHDVRFSVQLGSTTANRKGFQWFFGINNFADKHPPLGSAGTGSGSAIYNVFGRTFFTGFRATL